MAPAHCRTHPLFSSEHPCLSVYSVTRVSQADQDVAEMQFVQDNAVVNCFPYDTRVHMAWIWRSLQGKLFNDRTIRS